MHEILTLSEIKKRYKGEWVLLADPQLTRNLEVIRGKVVLHCKNREEFDRESLKLKGKHWAILFTGKIPKNTAVVL